MTASTRAAVSSLLTAVIAVAVAIGAQRIGQLLGMVDLVTIVALSMTAAVAWARSRGEFERPIGVRAFRF